MSIAPQTETDVANLALAAIGEPPITSLADPSSRGKAINLHFAATRRKVLRAHDWNFCSAWVLPAMSPQLGLGTLQNRFPLPDDCLKVREVTQQRATITSNTGISITDPNIIAELEASQPVYPADEQWWQIENVTVNPSDVASATMMLVTSMTVPLVNYTRDVTLIRLWDAEFLTAFVQELAGAVAPGIAKDINAGEKKAAMAEELIDKASRTDSREQSPKHVDRNTSWIMARVVGVARSRSWGRQW